MINTPSLTRSTTTAWRTLAITIVLASIPQLTFADGFEPPSWREAARYFGVGVGAGYHNQPCQPHRAREYNRMLYGCANPGWLAWKQSQLANRVPHGTVISGWPGEDGTPPCSRNVYNGWALPAPTRAAGDQSIETPQIEPDGEEARIHDGSSNSLFGPNVRSEIDDGQSNVEQARDPQFENRPSDTRDEITPEQRRSIEQLLEGVGIGEENDQATYNEFAPGEESWKRLSHESKDSFRPDFPNKSIPGSVRSPRKPTNNRASRTQHNSHWW